MIGDGRLAEPEAIVKPCWPSSMAATIWPERRLVTAAGTREAIDPVRFFGNRSSGKMGYAVAEEAQRRGARVVLVSGHRLASAGQCELVSVVSAEDMRRGSQPPRSGHDCHQGRRGR